MIIPKWSYKLPLKRLQDIKVARSTLDSFMREQIAVKKREIAQAKSDVHGPESGETRGMDIFTRLTKANEEEGMSGLNDDELVRRTIVYTTVLKP